MVNLWLDFLYKITGSGERTLLDQLLESLFDKRREIIGLRIIEV